MEYRVKRSPGNGEACLGIIEFLIDKNNMGINDVLFHISCDFGIRLNEEAECLRERILR